MESLDIFNNYFIDLIIEIIHYLIRLHTTVINLKLIESFIFEKINKYYRLFSTVLY